MNKRLDVLKYTNHQKSKHGSYGAKLFDKRWRELRKKVIHRDLEQCVVCNSREELQVHHKQYHFNKNTRKFKEPWEYSAKYLITLCRKCHQKGHQKFEVPTKYI